MSGEPSSILIRRLERFEEKLDKIVDGLAGKAEQATLEVVRGRIHDQGNFIQKVALEGHQRENRIAALEQSATTLMNEHNRRAGSDITKRQLWGAVATIVLAVAAVATVLVSIFKGPAP